MELLDQLMEWLTAAFPYVLGLVGLLVVIAILDRQGRPPKDGGFGREP